MRHLCTEDLVSHAEGRTPPEAKEPIEHHIVACRSCADEVALWTDVIQSLRRADLVSAPRSVLRQCFAMHQTPKPGGLLREIVARLTFDSASEPLLSGIRGATECQHVLLESADAEVYLRISGGSRTILGQLLRSDGDFVAGARAELRLAGKTIDVTLTDTLGEFRFNTAPDGHLRLHAEIFPDRRFIGDFEIRKFGR